MGGLLVTPDHWASLLAGLLAGGTMVAAGVFRGYRTDQTVPGTYWVIAVAAGLGVSLLVAMALSLPQDHTSLLFLGGILFLTCLVALEAVRTGQLNARTLLVILGGIASAVIWILALR